MRWFCILFVVTGCGRRCKDIENAHAAFAAQTRAPDRIADVRITLPFAQLDPIFADQLAAVPLTVALDVPDYAWTATATELHVLPGPDQTIRFATRIAVRDGDQEVTTLAAEIDVAPVVTRDELVIGFGPKDVTSVRPILGDDAKARLGAAVARHLPFRDKVPQRLVDEAAAALAGRLTGVAFEGLRRSLFTRLGEVATWRVALPAIPLARHAIRSTPTALVVELVTELPVRRGLDPAVDRDVATVEIAASAGAELANWAIAHGHAPRWFDRDLHPRDDGEFTPHFDWIPGDAHPFKVHVLQERDGCSYFRVGVAATVGLSGDKLEVVATDRDLETVSANPLLEVAATVKFFLFGWVDESKQIAAHSTLHAGKRSLVTRVVSATLERDALRFGLAFR